MLLTSLQNPRIKFLVKLRDRRPRDREGKFLIEGYRGVRRALANGWPMEELYVCPELFQGENEDELIEACREAGTAVFETTPPVFRKIAYRDRPEGLLALSPQRRTALAELPIPERPPLYLVAEGIEKPGNLGTMLRSADATGVDALLLADACTDLFNPNVVRASTGSLFHVPVAECTTAEALAWLRARGVRTLAATPHAESLYTDVDMTGPLAIAVGTEQYGLTTPWIEGADIAVRIPMLGQADSLNVSTATALLLYEAVRQRLPKGLTPTPRDDHGSAEH
jgi:TrmH family RNA methyltransferase